MHCAQDSINDLVAIDAILSLDDRMGSIATGFR
jgi:hypothetical protein